jgi:autotransporter-associated beta strand protein
MNPTHTRLAAGASGGSDNSAEAKMKRYQKQSLMFAALSAAISGLTFLTQASAGTATWIGSVIDPGDPVNSIPSTNGYAWDATTPNWSNSNGSNLYVPADTLNAIAGDDVIFTDNFAGGTDIYMPVSTMNPATVTFKHIAGSNPTNYTFFGGGNATFPEQIGGGQTFNGNTFLGAGTQGVVLTLDTGFLGKVTLRPRANGGSTNGNTIIRSGTLELNDALAMPGGLTTNAPPVTLDGGELMINVNTRGNTQPGSTNLTGQMTVASNSFLTNNRSGVTSARLYNGPITFASTSTVLEVKSLHAGVQMNFGANLTASTGIVRVGNVAGVPQVLRLDTNNTQGAAVTLDLGSASDSLLRVNQGTAVISTATAVPLPRVVNVGHLISTSADQSIEGATNTNHSIEYSIGALNQNSVLAGKVVDGTGVPSGITARVSRTYLNKVGTGSLRIANPNSLWTGTTTVTAGTLEIVGPVANATVLNAAGYSIDDDENSSTPDDVNLLDYELGGVNIKGGRLVVDYAGGSTPASTVSTLLATSYANAGVAPHFNSGQIRSTTSTATVGLGWLDDTAASKLTIAAALYGDANLSGSVEFNDLLALAQAYNLSGSWVNGDFDYDGTVGFNDLLTLAQAYGSSLLQNGSIQIDQAVAADFAADWQLALSMVPEPATLGVVAVGAMLGLRRRR